jgi:hypothetical protein
MDVQDMEFVKTGDAFVKMAGKDLTVLLKSAINLASMEEDALMELAIAQQGSKEITVNMKHVSMTAIVSTLYKFRPWNL